MKILFDLDGTLTDSGPGIMRCAAEALLPYGIRLDEAALRRFVGPPLRDSFARCGVPAEEIETAIARFRARYWESGKFENTPYPGIAALLERLRQAGHRLFITTSKPESLAVEVLAHFDLAHCFERICGASEDASRERKEQVIACLLEQIGAQGPIVMVGDTALDVRGAAAFGIPAIAVAWGYGTPEELRAAKPAAIAHDTAELFALLTAMDN